MPRTFFKELSEDYIQLFESGYDHNVVIEVGKPPNVQRFQAHSSILYQRSSYFRQKLDVAIKKNNIIEIKLPNISVQAFNHVIRFIYSGSIGLEMMRVTDKFEILKISLEFKLASLIKYIQANLVRNSGSWVQSSFAHSYQMIIENDGLNELRQFCDEIFKTYPNMIFLSEDFITLQEHILISILKHEDIQPDESLVLDKILLWGKARTPNLPTNIRQWTSWDYLSLKATLQNLLPFIKCGQNRNGPKKSYEPPNKSNVYKHIPDNDVWESILERCSIQSQPPPNLQPSNLPPSNLSPSNLPPSNLPHSNLSPSNLPPPKRMRMESSIIQSSPSHSYSIITLQHLAEISSWIDRRSTTYDISNIPYGFRLLFKSSKHGFSSDAFHKLCDNIRSTMIVGKVRGTNELIGGYNPLTWKTNEYKPDDYEETEDSFIFSLQINNDDGEPSILSRVHNSSKAINHYTSLVNGVGFGRHDLRIGTNRSTSKWQCNQKDYELSIRKVFGAGWFFVDEFEVFQICKLPQFH